MMIMVIRQELWRRLRYLECGAGELHYDDDETGKMKENLVPKIRGRAVCSKRNFN